MTHRRTNVGDIRIRGAQFGNDAVKIIKDDIFGFFTDQIPPFLKILLLFLNRIQYWLCLFGFTLHRPTFFIVTLLSSGFEVSRAAHPKAPNKTPWNCIPSRGSFNGLSNATMRVKLGTFAIFFTRDLNSGNGAFRKLARLLVALWFTHHQTIEFAQRFLLVFVRGNRPVERTRFVVILEMGTTHSGLQYHADALVVQRIAANSVHAGISHVMWFAGFIDHH